MWRNWTRHVERLFFMQTQSKYKFSIAKCNWNQHRLQWCLLYPSKMYVIDLILDGYVSELLLCLILTLVRQAHLFADPGFLLAHATFSLTHFPSHFN